MNRLVSSSALAALAALAACGDATAPTKTVSVTVNVTSVQGPTYSENADHVPQVACRVNLQAVATGEGRATWSGATLRFYIGPDHQTLVDTATFSGSEIGQSWSEDGQIGVGQVQSSYWDITAAIPFYVTIDYRYKPPNRGEDTTSASFACGMPAAFNAAPPVVTALTVTPPSGELPAGAPLTVTYMASAPAGLWRTDVVISGPCDFVATFNENLKTSSTRTVAVSLPSECQLGVPITATVYSIDAFAQIGQRTLPTTVVLADHEPPSLYMFSSNGYGGYGVETFKGDYFSGDAINFYANVYDNHRLSTVVWEVLPFGVRDSALVSGVHDYYSGQVRLRPEWSGPLQVRFFVRDAAGLTSPVQTTLPDSLRVHPVVERPTRTATVTGETRAIAIDSRRGLIYLAQGNDHRLAIFSMATLQLTGTVELPAVPTDLDLTPSGDSLLVVLYGRTSLSVIDLTGATAVLSTLPLSWLDATTNQLPVNVRVAANGRAYLTLGGTAASARRLVELNLSDGSVRTLSQAGNGGDIGSGQLERSFDGSVLVLDEGEPWCMQRYDVATDAFSACVQPRIRDGRPIVDATGSRVAEGLDIYDESLRLLPKVHGDLMGGIPLSVLSADGASLFVSWWGLGYIRLRTSDSEILDRTPSALQTTLVRVSPDGATLVSIESNYGPTTKISLIDLR